jgi:crossover junction endodeoxyribonuclease RuvC
VHADPGSARVGDRHEGDDRLKRRADETRPLRVVGLDPGLANLGLGAIAEEGKTYRLLGTEMVKTSSGRDQAARLAHIFQAVAGFLDRHEPHALAIEGQFFHRQRDVAFKVGQAFGVCLLAAADRDVPVFEYGPMQVKQALVGNGRASKAQVEFMVRGILELDTRPETNHVADALALALTHCNHRSLAELG